nr:immunoglobulin light chain junction region [Macaca mulatta]
DYYCGSWDNNGNHYIF